MYLPASIGYSDCCWPTWLICGTGSGPGRHPANVTRAGRDKRADESRGFVPLYKLYIGSTKRNGDAIEEGYSPRWEGGRERKNASTISLTERSIPRRGMSLWTEIACAAEVLQGTSKRAPADDEEDFGERERERDRQAMRPFRGLCLRQRERESEGEAEPTEPTEPTTLLYTTLHYTTLHITTLYTRTNTKTIKHVMNLDVAGSREPTR